MKITALLLASSLTLCALTAHAAPQMPQTDASATASEPATPTSSASDLNSNTTSRPASEPQTVSE